MDHFRGFLWPLKARLVSFVELIKEVIAIVRHLKIQKVGSEFTKIIDSDVGQILSKFKRLKITGLKKMNLFY